MFTVSTLLPVHQRVNFRELLMVWKALISDLLVRSKLSGTGLLSVLS